MRTATVLRACKLTAAALWAGLLVVAGVLLWAVHPIVAICAVAGGECVAMWLIADDLWPRALPEVTGFFKLTAALLFFGHLITAVWLLWP